MSRPWDEPWDFDEDRILVVGNGFEPTYGNDPRMPARARLASAAPMMVHLLLDSEWQYRPGSEYRRCPFCDGDETTRHEPRTGHREDCRLVDVLTKAGVLDATLSKLTTLTNSQPESKGNGGA